MNLVKLQEVVRVVLDDEHIVLPGQLLGRKITSKQALINSITASLTPLSTGSSFTDLIHFLLPLSCHRGTGGVPSVGDGVEDLWSGAARLVDLCRVPPRQNLPQGCGDHAVLIAGNVD